jgi:hypothetical protein
MSPRAAVAAQALRYPPAMRVTAALASCLFALASTDAVGADDSMRCGNRLVTAGDGKDKVRTLCGEPTDIAFRGVARSPRHYDRWDYDYSWVGPSWEELPVEIWTYNFGSSKLLRKLRFVGDQLVEIRTDGYGY